MFVFYAHQSTSNTHSTHTQVPAENQTQTKERTKSYRKSHLQYHKLNTNGYYGQWSRMSI